MDHFLYRDGLLYAEDVALADIAAAVGTPFYCYSSATLLRHFRLFKEALSGMDHLVCYAMKAASNQAILQTLAAEGAGMDVVSGGNMPAPKLLVCQASGSCFPVLARPETKFAPCWRVVSDSSMSNLSPR